MSALKIGVIGLGYVGFPLAQLLAEYGNEVHGIDIDEHKVDLLNHRKSYLSDFTDNEVYELFATNNFKVSNSYEAVKHLDVVIICVPTPIDEDNCPDLRYVLSAVNGMIPYLQPGQLVVLESSTYPGTCDELLKPLLESTGLIIGHDLYLAYSPERINPGTHWKLQDIPKIVSGHTPLCIAYVKRVYESVFKEIVPVSSLRTAEMIKLLENSQRFVNISLMNSLLKVAHRMNVNLWEVIDAASTKPFGFTPYYPSPGIGGHCIPVDPLFLHWKAKEFEIDLPFIQLSQQINSEMPAYIVERLEELLLPKKLHNSSVLLVGVTYKKDVNDIRESPALKIIKMLREMKTQIFFFDPFFQKLSVDGIELPYMALTQSNMKRVDCTVILTDHSNISYAQIIEHSSLVFDTRNATAGMENRNNIIYL